MRENVNIRKLQQWIGKTETGYDTVTVFPLQALDATFDEEPKQYKGAFAISALRHWLYFLPVTKHSALGADGHPQRGGFLPPVPLPRRMWAGSQFEFHQPLCIGDAIARVSTIQNVSHKRGKSGDLIFVRVRHDIHRLGSENSAPNKENKAITEHHDIVYREPAQLQGQAGTEETVSRARLAPPQHAWHHEITVNDVMLFRYSALTFNGHRIHYDRPYATEQEGYPGLVVHGPLIATLLLDALRKHLPGKTVTHYEFTAIAPLFDTDSFSICGLPEPSNQCVQLWAMNSKKELAMKATATLQLE